MGSVDLHCHMLPGIDDGSKSLEQSLAMARQAVADGISISVVTPHHMNGVYRNPADAVRSRVKQLQSALERAGIELKLVPGSELHLVPELPQALKRGEAITFADRGKAALVELPVHTVPVGSDELLDRIMRQGITPVIAHPERNTHLRHYPGLLAEWIEAGCLAQVTAQSCTGQFGPYVQEAAREMVTSGMIHFVASDAHRDRRRVPKISEGRAQIEAWTNPAVAQLLAEVFPRSLVHGQPVSPGLLRNALPEKRKRGFIQRWLGR